jgi:hypothetical protein
VQVGRVGEGGFVGLGIVLCMGGKILLLSCNRWKLTRRQQQTSEMLDLLFTLVNVPLRMTPWATSRPCVDTQLMLRRYCSVCLGADMPASLGGYGLAALCSFVQLCAALCSFVQRCAVLCSFCRARALLLPPTK